VVLGLCWKGSTVASVSPVNGSRKQQRTVCVLRPGAVHKSQIKKRVIDDTSIPCVFAATRSHHSSIMPCGGPSLPLQDPRSCGCQNLMPLRLMAQCRVPRWVLHPWKRLEAPPAFWPAVVLLVEPRVLMNFESALPLFPNRCVLFLQESG
jgi:hypothetical protein